MKRKPNKRHDDRQEQLPLRDPGQPTLGKVIEWYTREYLSGANSQDAQLRLSTIRGYKSTFRLALRELGKDAIPTKGDARAWLRPKLASEGGRLRARAVNAHRDRLHAAYVRYREDKEGVTLNPWSFPRFSEDTKHLRTSADAIAKAWPLLLEAMPDDRARLFLSLAWRLGWRLGELLGLEEGHVLRTTKGEWQVRKEQQRKLWEDVPTGLKHDGLVGTFKMHPEMVKLWRATHYARETGKPMLGCARGSLVGTTPGKDGLVRRFLFPYREEHLAELTARLRAACPEEFPKGQAWHRLRRAFGKHTAMTQGYERTNRLLGHKFMTSTQAYCRDVVGVAATGEDMDALYAAQDSMLSPSHHEAHNTFEGVEQ